jgi:hypothetical protein
LGICTPAIAKLLNILVVVTLHSIAEAVNLDNIGYKYSAINKLEYRLATKLILRADVVSLTNNHLIDIIKQEYGSKKM